MKNKCSFLLIPLILLMTIPGSYCQDIQCGEQVPKDFKNPADGICSSLFIRQSVDKLRLLENCTVIEGFLHISFIDYVTSDDFDKWSFPMLREITGYLTLNLLYRLKSLRTLFPNLSVIRGRQLFHNYALVVYDMIDLEDLGLVNLRVISRGEVSIGKCPKLCYVDTVDWRFLGVDPDFKDKRDKSLCVNSCPTNCTTTAVGNGDTKRCWTSDHCQKGINCKCNTNQTCMDNGTCCHEYCLSGCSGPGPNNCFSCKRVVYNGSCFMECPAGTYKYADRRCLTPNQCFAIVNNTENIAWNTKILGEDTDELRVCVTQCPQNYTVQEVGKFKHLKCIKCEGFCPKVCNSSFIKSIQDAQTLKDCSKINGYLLIQILGGNNIADELERNLGSIKEVTDFIFIDRSYVLMTLYFLKSLETIGGENLYNNKSSFIAMDNSDLQDLFPEEQMRKMKLKRGILSFHTNRKLCNSKIKSFVKHLNLTEDKQDIGNNGNLMPCNDLMLSLIVTEVYHNAVLLNWTKDQGDDRHLLSYIINYKEIKFKDEDLNIYEGREICSADTWMTNEALPTGDSYQTYALNNLKAYTEYAVYVQAYTLSTATYTAMTNIITFKTNAYYPTEPLELEVTANDLNELYVKWKPPKFPNGIVTHYKVLYQKQEMDIKSFEQRDYCLEPISALSETSKNEKVEVKNMSNATADCCSCPKTKEEREAEARKREIEIYFENYLHDQVYCQRYDTLPPDIKLNNITFDMINVKSYNNGNITTSSGDELLTPTYNTNTTTADNITQSSTVRNNSITGVIQEVIVNDTSISLTNLEHFQEYSIEVQACHDTYPDEPVSTKLCSYRALTAGRTMQSWVMDKINESTIDIKIIKNTTVDVMITWKPPPKPNGLILTYNIFYKRANQENLVPLQICVNIKEFQKHSGYRLTDIDPGNWTFQINAVSLAGNSSFTSEKYFIVPHSPDDEDMNKTAIILTVMAVLVLIIIVIAALAYAKYRFRKDELSVISPNVNYISSEPMYTMDGWEVDRDKIKLIKELGQGSFGMVYEGLAKGLGDDPDEETMVAVKTVNDRASFNDKREFLKEATTMKAFDCYHVVKLIGVVSTGQPALVIMELMTLGDLKNYLRKHRPDEQEEPGVSPPKLLDILQMAGEIADGMAYLADKKFVHRDLAARNCMVAEDKTVKIGDFGMTRDIYETDYYRKGGKGMLPVRWMSPESLRDGVFTSMSDIWSYGVVIWEMVTLAAQPYQGLSNEEVVKYISEDNTMDIPEGCPHEMAYMMQRCWTKKSKNRPTFKDIIEYLLPHLNPRFEKVSYFFNDGGGPTGRDRNLLEELYPTEDSFDGESINSLSYGATAAPQLSLTNNSGNYMFHGSPRASGGSVSLYDDDMDQERFSIDDEGGHFYHQRRDSHIDENFDDFSDYNIQNEFGVNLDDSSQPFISDDFQAIPLVKTRHPSLLSYDHQTGNDSMLHHSGLVELQPLINKDYGPSPPSPRLTNTQSSSSPYSSECIVQHPQTVTTYDLRAPSDSQTLHQHHKAGTDSLKSDPASSSSSSQLEQPHWAPSANQLPLSTITRPPLRLPTLNQPPGGGFRRVPPYSQEERRDSFSSRNSQRHNQPSSSDWDHYHHEQQPPATSNVNVVNISEEETSPSSSARHNFSPNGAITSSSDGSKESSKSSDSHSHINGLTNGHIPTVRHRTAPC